jgi:hypothetical protein
MQLLPIALPIGLTVNAMTFAVSPWGVPAFAGMVGATAANEPTLVVGFETPSSWIRLSEPLDKPTLETILVRRYSLDQRLATGTHAFAAVQPGSDPPDVIAQTDSGPLGVESTALAIESRREVHGLFLALRQRLIMTEPVALAKLAGYFVYVWFEAPAPTALDKPHRRSDDAAIQALVEELKTYEPQHQQLWVPEGPLPPQAPPLPTATTPAGAKFYAVPFAGGVPGTMLFAFSGFEIGLAYTTTTGPASMCCSSPRAGRTCTATCSRPRRRSATSLSPTRSASSASRPTSRRLSCTRGQLAARRSCTRRLSRRLARSTSRPCRPITRSPRAAHSVACCTAAQPGYQADRRVLPRNRRD